MSQTILLHQAQADRQAAWPCIAGNTRSPFGCLAIRIRLEPGREYTFFIPRWLGEAALLLAGVVPMLRAQLKQNRLHVRQLRQLLRGSARPGQILSLDLLVRNGVIVRVNGTELAAARNRSERMAGPDLSLDRPVPMQTALFSPFLQRLDR